MNTSNTQLNRRRLRTRAKINGTTVRPRLSVKLTNRHITAQIVDDTRGTTLAFVTTVKRDLTGSMTERAAWAGSELAGVAHKRKITKVVFDRSSKLYHGRLRALADAARQGGLEF